MVKSVSLMYVDVLLEKHTIPMEIVKLNPKVGSTMSGMAIQGVEF